MPHLSMSTSNKAPLGGACPLPTLVQAVKRIGRVKPCEPRRGTERRGKETWVVAMTMGSRFHLHRVKISILPGEFPYPCLKACWDGEGEKIEVI